MLGIVAMVLFVCIGFSSYLLIDVLGKWIKDTIDYLLVISVGRIFPKVSIKTKVTLILLLGFSIFLFIAYLQDNRYMAEQHRLREQYERANKQLKENQSQ